MADKKPEAKKPAAPSGGGMFELEAKIIMVVVFLIIIYLALGQYVLKDLGFDTKNFYNQFILGVLKALDAFNWLFNTVFFLAIFLTLLLVLARFYVRTKYKEVTALYKISLPKGFIASSSSTAKAEAEVAAEMMSNNGAAGGGGASDNGNGNGNGYTTDENGKPILNASGENKKWNEVEKHIASMNSSDWRMAILEADIMLYEMLDQMGYDGETVADKLKQIESSDFSTLDLAWRAHKVRNVIAHEGTSYALSYEQARDTIDMYRKVFAEFYFI